MWSPSATRDQHSSATSTYPSSTSGPNDSARIATEPDATAQWIEIFHTNVIAASTATLPSMKARYPVSSRGAPATTSTTSPAATDPVMNPSTMSRGRRAPTVRSLHSPRRTP